MSFIAMICGTICGVILAFLCAVFFMLVGNEIKLHNESFKQKQQGA